MFTTFSATSGIISVIIGRLYKFIPFCLFVLIAIIICLTLSFFLIFWEREANFIVIFGFAIGWGWCDATWHTIIQSKLLNNNNIIDIIICITVLTGVLFEDKKESAYSILQLASAVSLTIGFTLPLFSSTIVELSIIIIIVIIASVTTTILSINISNKLHCTHFSKC